MSKVKHVDITPEQGVHVIHDFVVPGDANTLAELAGNPKIAIGKVAFRVSDTSFHICTDTAPALVWQQLGAGAGDVAGPAGATDNAVVRFDLTTGKLIQNSLVTISDAGSISLPAAQTVDGRDVSADGAALDAHLASTATSTTTIYVDAVSGNDTGDGTVGSPVQTLSRAGQLSPTVSSADVVYRLVSAGNYAYSECPTTFTGQGRWVLFGTSASRVTVRTGTAGAGTDANQIAATGLTVNQDQHYVLEMTAGAASGYRRHVQSNTATSIIPVRRFENQLATSTVTPASGDTFTVYRPGALITGLTSLSGKKITLWDVAFDTVAASPTITDCEIFGSGVEFRGTVFPHFVRCTGSFGQWDNIDASSVPLNSAFTHWSLPYSTERSASMANLFSAVGLSASLTTLAQHRGCGMSCPSVTATVTSASGGHLLFTQSAMSLMGVFGAVSHDQGVYLCGGWYWGNFRAHAQSNVLVTGRAGSGVNLADSTYFRRRIDLDRNSAVYCASPVRSSPNGFAMTNILDGSTLTLAGTGSVLGDSVSSDSLGTIDRGGALAIDGSTTINMNSSTTTYNGFGAPSLFNGSRIRINAALTITNSGTRSFWVKSSIVEVVGGSLSFTGSGGILVTDGGVLRGNSAITCTNGPLVIDGGYVSVGANLTIATPPADGIVVKNSGTLAQISGVLSSTPVSGSGLVVQRGGKALLRATTDCVLTGTGAGVGCSAASGSLVTFEGAPTSVTGPAGADLKVGGAAAVANTVLAAVNDAITDSAGAVIMRAA